MNKLIPKVKHSWPFLLFVFLFAYAQSIQIRLWARGSVNEYIFTPEAAIASFSSACILFLIIYLLIKSQQRSDTFTLKEFLTIFSTSILSYLIVMNVLGLILACIFGTFERNFNKETLILSSISDIMDALIYGSFFLAFYYYHKNNKKQKQILQYNQALSETKIKQLKTQLNPHFLFNNLNVLDQFIEEDKGKASDFLHEFADIYRYVLQVSDRNLIPIEEEITFVKKYFGLMQHKYENAYQLNIDNTSTHAYIVPLTLQLLLENAIQHNLGTEENPILIEICINTAIVVSNNIISKRNPKITSGRALNNLKEQYSLLTNHKVEVKQSEDFFSVVLPLIRINKQ